MQASASKEFPLASKLAQPAPIVPADPHEAIAPVPPGAEALIGAVMDRLDDDQAQDVVLIDLQGKSSLADAIVVASGRSQRHVSAMADHLVRALKTGGWGKARVEGLPQADWVLIDADDVIVHLFRPEVRAFYNIEKIWSVEPPRGGARTRQDFAPGADLSEPELLDDDADEEAPDAPPGDVGSDRARSDQDGSI